MIYGLGDPYLPMSKWQACQTDVQTTGRLSGQTKIQLRARTISGDQVAPTGADRRAVHDAPVTHSTSKCGCVQNVGRPASMGRPPNSDVM